MWTRRMDGMGYQRNQAARFARLRSGMAMSAIGVGVALIGACGSPPPPCTTGDCLAPSSRTYQVCTPTGSTVSTYTYGTQTCECDTSSPQSQMCTDCTNALAAFCMM